MSQALNKSSGNSPSPNPVATGPSPNLLNNQPNVAQPQQPYNPVFTTDKIQQTKATKPREYFDEQNRKTAERKKQNRKVRNRVLAIGLPSLTAVIVVIVALVIILQPADPDAKVPADMKIWNGEAQDLQASAQKIYDIRPTPPDNDGSSSDVGDISGVDDFFNQKVEQAPNSETKNNIVLVEMQFYSDNFLPTQVIKTGEKLNINDLTTNQAGIYVGLLYNAYMNMGNTDGAAPYLELMSTYETEINDGDEV